MQTFTLRVAADAFATVDEMTEAAKVILDKAVRNLSQRVYLPPAGRDARAGVYSLHTICALRLIQIASSFGLDRWQLEDFAAWLQHERPGVGRLVQAGGGLRPLSCIEESLERVRGGEKFSIHLVMLQGGTFEYRADWQPKSKIGNEQWPDKSEVARLSLPASELITAVVKALAV